MLSSTVNPLKTPFPNLSTRGKTSNPSLICTLNRKPNFKITLNKEKTIKTIRTCVSNTCSDISAADGGVFDGDSLVDVDTPTLNNKKPNFSTLNKEKMINTSDISSVDDGIRGGDGLAAVDRSTLNSEKPNCNNSNVRLSNENWRNKHIPDTCSDIPAGDCFEDDGDRRLAAVERLTVLVSEFDSLTEPIDRVRRLLDYASRLPPFDEEARVPVNKVTGCTTQVWLEARMERNGRMRFRADSDSEITKGFVSCLIWLFDGAWPEEVVAVKAEDLEVMNVGLHVGKVKSRVNTWHNVLISMQKRTSDLVVERDVEPFPSLLVVSPSQVHQSRWRELDANLLK